MESKDAQSDEYTEQMQNLYIPCPKNEGPTELLTSTEESLTSHQVAKNESLNFRIDLCKSYKICIYKPLIPLKLVLFCWYGAGSFFTPFITVYFKQRGITLTELSTAYIVAPAAQFCGTLVSGIIADKIGRSKPVLVANLVLTVLMLTCILSVPKPEVSACNVGLTRWNHSIECFSQQLEPLITNTNCYMEDITINNTFCHIQCSVNATEQCKSLTFHPNNFIDSFKNESFCTFINVTECKCLPVNGTLCSVSCTEDSTKCSKESKSNLLNMVTMLFYILLMVAYSNCYRFLDVTAMYLVKEHNSDFGRERFFSIAGILLVSPLAGCLVDATTVGQNEKNYASAFYLYIAIIILTLIIVYKLDVRIMSPGKKMLKKSLGLIKNPDVLSFALVVFILGTAWSFTTKFMFWYLEEMKAPSILIGLIPSTGALYGLPFLFTSNWWMNKIGTTKMFVVGLLGYVLYAIGYAFMNNPWISLGLEAFTVVTYHLLWVAVVLRSHELAPEGLTATVISIAGSLHYHIGKSSGSLIGGLVMSKYGGKTAFLVIAIICLVCAVLYALYLYNKNLSLTREPTRQKDKAIQDGGQNRDQHPDMA